MTLNLLSLCSGIGGAELGLELAGLGHLINTAQFVEKDKFCQDVLRKNFQGLPIHDDIRSFRPLPCKFDIVCAGFPCQPHSQAGKQKASKDKRDLWSEVYRIICEVQPQGILLENVPGLRTSEGGAFFKRVVGQLADSGYIVEWGHTTVASVGGVHRRKRIWILAYSSSIRRNDWKHYWERRYLQAEPFRDNTENKSQWERWQFGVSSDGKISPNPSSQRRLTSRGAIATKEGTIRASNSEGSALQATGTQAQSPIRRSANGIPTGMGDWLIGFDNLDEWLDKATDTDDNPLRKAQLTALGNAICPAQIAPVWQRLAKLLLS